MHSLPNIRSLPWCGGTGGRTPAGPSQTADSASPSGRGPPHTSPVKRLGSINKSVYRWPWCGGTGGRTPAGPSQTADSASPSGRGPPRTSPVKGLGSINQSVYRWPWSETLYHRDDALLYIAYVMLIWAAPIPADRWHCSLWPQLTPWVDWYAPSNRDKLCPDSALQV